ncbi:MAG: serine/threonine-protein phosphatase [Clostridia bacterium]|nr:serine/threonine-protein phosphatase [Clostridia bacterium]
MSFLDKKKRIQATVTSLIYLLFIGFGVVLVWLRGISSLESTYLINISVDLFGMSMGYVLFICCLIDVQKTGNDQRYFAYLLNVAYFGLFCDLIAWLVEGLPEWRTVNIIDNTLYFMCMPVGAYFFWQYVTSALRSDKRIDKIIGRIMGAVLALALVTRILNLFTGMYFTVDEAGVYHRGTYYAISMAYVYLALIASCILILLRRRELKHAHTAVLLIYILVPAAVSFFSMAVYGLSISYGVIMLMLLLMYCVLNIDQGRDKVVADRELNMATQIQESMLPSIFPAFPDRSEFDVYASMTPAREVGGDFYDFFLIDDDHLCMVMADVSGKGVPAALFMMASKIILANHAMSGKSPAQILTDTNNAICANNRMELFVTVWLGILELSTGKLTAANAGHEYPAIRQANGAFELLHDKHGFVIGGMEGVPYKEYELTLTPGSKVFLYTDGVPEATDAQGDMFGTDRMLNALNEAVDGTPEAVLTQVRRGVDAFVKKAEQFDDLTMLCLEYKGGQG